MKKVLSVLAVGAFLFTITSCKKDWTCKCTVSGGGTDISSSTTINATKSDAEEACTASETTVGTVTSSCEIVE